MRIKDHIIISNDVMHGMFVTTSLTKTFWCVILAQVHNLCLSCNSHINLPLKKTNNIKDNNAYLIKNAITT